MNLIKRLDSLLQNYRDLRLSLGYNVKKRYVADEFCEYLGVHYSDENAVTKEMFDKWLCQRVFATNSHHLHCVTNIRMFLRYLRFTGEDVYVPDEDYSVRVERFLPYTFTDDELMRLFHAFDSVVPDKGSPCREYITPVLFRLMYCCGMRPGEPLSVLKEDFDLNTGELYIRQAKGYKDRRILVSNDVLQLCRNYAGHMKTGRYFFERNPGEQIATHWMRNQFDSAWELSGIQSVRKARPYDLRHNFATRTIIRWVNEGKNATELLPYLSEYLGHTTLASTAYYIHLVPERIFTNKGIDWQRFKSIYSEVANEKSQS